jgi:hypothetical protein
MTDAALILVRRNDGYIAERCERLRECDDPIASVTVVVRDENLRAIAHAVFCSAAPTRVDSRYETIVRTSAPKNADQNPSTVSPIPRWATM